MKPKRIIFLDIDGCVNSDNWYTKTRGKQGDFDPNVIKRLNTLEKYGVEVVVSSSWGDDGVEQLKNVSLKLPILGSTDHFHTDCLCRGNEIEKWIHDNLGGLGTKYGYDEDGEPYYKKRYKDTDADYEYVILDDDTDMLLGQKDHFIHVDRWKGITDVDIKFAKSILKCDEQKK